MNNFKFIYEFSVDNEVEVEKTETKEENGVKTSTTTKVKEKKPIQFGFKKPSRAERESADEYQASCWSKYVEAGIWPEALLLKKYSSNGGVLADTDKNQIVNLQLNLLEKKNAFQLAKVENKPQEELDKLAKDVVSIQNDILEWQRVQASFYEHTAESKARLKYLEYLILILTYCKQTDNWEPFFKGENVIEKIAFLETIEDDENHLYQKVKNKLAFIASLYVSAGGNLKKEDIENFEKEFSL